MNLTWTYTNQSPALIKDFLKEQGVSRGLLARAKQEGSITVNGTEQIVLYALQFGDELTVCFPDEGSHPKIATSNQPIAILYEDEHFLAVNKPAGVASIPSNLHPIDTMANRVKGYFEKIQPNNCIPHLVTRLDRDTTGVMLFAKHRLAHAWLDKLLRAKQVKKTYQAIVQNGSQLQPHGMIDYPIGRTSDSIITRCVTPAGKLALTEYWLEKEMNDSVLVRIRLHTGRTHQIRVHFEAIGATLIGDGLYGGRVEYPLERQALHCYSITFIHPVTSKEIVIQSSLPQDMCEWLEIHS